MGATWIEVDVFMADGKLVVIHDRWLERTSNGTGDVTQKTISYLRSLDVGGGEKIPFLTEVIDTVAGRAGINIELKGPGTAEPTAKLLISYIENGMAAERFLISSFDQHQLVVVKKMAPHIPTGVNIYSPPLGQAAFTESLGVSSVHMHANFVSKAFVEDAHRRGLKVFAFTVNQREEIYRLEAMGVDGIFTNYPELAH